MIPTFAQAKVLLKEKFTAVAMAAGLGTLGLTTYLFLVLAGRKLGDASYAPLGTLWVLVYLLGPGFFFPIEQEITRAVSAHRALGQGSRAVILKAARLALVFAVIAAVIIVALTGVIAHSLFNGNHLLVVWLAASCFTFAAEYVARGALAGSSSFSAYGSLMAAEGSIRLIAAIALIVSGTATAGTFGVLIVLAPIAAVIVGALVNRAPFDEEGEASYKELSTSLGPLLGASLFSQTLANAAPLVVKALASASQQALSGAFVKAVIITRIPLFLFQAVSAALLPRLTLHATLGRAKEFRRLTMLLLLAVAVIGSVATVFLWALAPWILKIFGATTPLPRVNLALLSAGSSLYLLALASGQALVSLGRHKYTTAGWLCGVVVFAAVAAIPMSLLARAEWAFLTGSAVAFIAMAISIEMATKALERLSVDPTYLVGTSNTM